MPPVPDETTLAALRTRSLALTEDGGDRVRSTYGPVLAALPLDYLDGCAGALTLLGEGPFSPERFGVVVDLISFLPHLCSGLRERRTLALTSVCIEILRAADLASPDGPLPLETLREYLQGICAAIAGDLGCGRVSLYLREPADPDDLYPLVTTSSEASTSPQAVRCGEGCVGQVIAHARASTASAASTPDVPSQRSDARRERWPRGDEDTMIIPVVWGQCVWGAVECGGAQERGVPLAPSDRFILEPVASQLARYWSGWNTRQAAVQENLSWRSLAAGMADFNRSLARELDKKSSNDAAVYDVAGRVLQSVIDECRGTVVHRPARGGGQPPVPVWSSSTGTASLLPRSRSENPAVSPAVRRTWNEGDQLATVDAGNLAAEPSIAGTGADWLLTTLVRVGERRFGTLQAYGSSPHVPPNSPQVSEIVSDQLGLYHYLQETLQHLRETRQSLESTIRGQAEALEDLEHQLVSPLIGATQRTDRVLQVGRFDTRTEAQLRAVRGLCRKASRVAMSAGVFATLSKCHRPSARLEWLNQDDLTRLLIAAAADVQQLTDPRRKVRFEVDRDSVSRLGRRLVRVDRSFLEQCVGNLLDNAAKYCFEDSQVDVRADLALPFLVIDVASVGIPLARQEVDRCRHRNWRGATAKTMTGEGSGIGLWIVDHLMTAMDGSLQILVDGDAFHAALACPIAR
jgi:signal transduction histidine kinase